MRDWLRVVAKQKIKPFEQAYIIIQSFKQLKPLPDVDQQMSYVGPMVKIGRLYLSAKFLCKLGENSHSYVALFL